MEAGARLEICELPSLALDMDLPEDLQMVSETLEKYMAELGQEDAIPYLVEESRSIILILWRASWSLGSKLLVLKYL